jgi:hypothetical protein
MSVPESAVLGVVALVLRPQEPRTAEGPRLSAARAVVAAGMCAGPIEFELVEGAVIVHGWPASQIAVLTQEESH